MSRKYARRGAFALRSLAAALAVAVTPTAVYADGHPRSGNGHDTYDVDALEWTGDPALLEDALFTDDAEAGITPETAALACNFESIISTAPSNPASLSMVALYFLPNDKTAVHHLDRPASCSDGSVRYSALAKASKNTENWMKNADADMAYRVLNYTYTHDFKGTTYSTRSVRRFRSARTTAWWNSQETYVAAEESAPRLDAMAAELRAAGWNQSNVKFSAVLDVSASVYQCSGTTCTYWRGVAQRGGQYGLVNRSMTNPVTGATTHQRFGCAVTGDYIKGHEDTHLAGADHVLDHSGDIMYGKGVSRTFKSSPALVWDYYKNNYHNTVKASGVAVGTTAPAGNYFTC